MAVKRESVFSLYNIDWRTYELQIGDSYFYRDRPNRQYWRQQMFTVISSVNDVMQVRRKSMFTTGMYFTPDTYHYNGETLYDNVERRVGYDRPRWLGIQIMTDNVCLFERERPEEIILIGGKARLYPDRPPNKMHVLVARTSPQYRTRYKCSGAEVSDCIELGHTSAIKLSQIGGLRHEITCTNCLRMVDRWLE